MKYLLVAFSFAVSGFLAGWLITISDDIDGTEIWYVGGLFFGIMYVVINSLFTKKPFHSAGAILLSVLAYFVATYLIAWGVLRPEIGAAIGAAIVTLSFGLLFGIRIPFGIAAIVAGGALGLLMYVTDIDHGYEMARTFAIWQCVVGTLLSVGLRRNDEK